MSNAQLPAFEQFIADLREVWAGDPDDAGRMEKNLAMTHGLIVAEAVMMGLAPHSGRNEAHDLVYDACRAAIETDRPLLDVLLETPAVADPLGPAKLRALTDPANYLGLAGDMVDRGP